MCYRLPSSLARLFSRFAFYEIVAKAASKVSKRTSTTGQGWLRTVYSTSIPIFEQIWCWYSDIYRLYCQQYLPICIRGNNNTVLYVFSIVRVRVQYWALTCGPAGPRRSAPSSWNGDVTMTLSRFIRRWFRIESVHFCCTAHATDWARRTTVFWYEGRFYS